MGTNDAPNGNAARARPVTVRSSVRAAAGVLLLGGLVFLAGVSRPVVTDWANASGDGSAEVAIAQARSGQFRLGFVLMGVGFIVMGLAVGMWGRAVACVETGRRATLARGAAVAATVGGLGLGGVRILTPLVSLERAATGSGVPDLAYMLGAIALALGFIVSGILTWRGPAPQWAGVLFGLSGLAGAFVFPAFYMFGAVGFGLVGVIQFRQRWRPKMA